MRLELDKLFFFFSLSATDAAAAAAYMMFVYDNVQLFT